MKPLVIDLFSGLGGWTEGFLAEGWDCVGFDIQRHEYGDKRYPAQLVLQDVLTIHGSQFKNADCIVASPPCQAYSWLAMPWSRSKNPDNSKAAKALRKKWETEGPDNRLFNACFRIQREAIEAACHCSCWRCKGGGHCVRCDRQHNTGKPARHIPLIVENVRGAVEWVGTQKAKFGSFYLWGDVEQIGNRIVVGADIVGFGGGVRGEPDAVKIGGDWFSDPNSTCRKHGSKSKARKAGSAVIAKIPPALSRYIAQTFGRKT